MSKMGLNGFRENGEIWVRIDTRKGPQNSINFRTFFGLVIFNVWDYMEKGSAAFCAVEPNGSQKGSPKVTKRVQS